MRTPPLLVALALFGAAFLAPGPSQTLVTTAAADPVQTNEVIMQGNGFVPSVIIILKGTQVIWTNTDSASANGLHSVTNDGGNLTYDKEVLPKEFAGTGLEKASQTFNNIGTYNYKCKHHDPMPGTVIVVEKFEAPSASVKAQQSKFVPQDVSINQTEKVTWQNMDGFAHDVTFEDASIGKVGDLPAGGTLDQTFDATGTFRYRCTIHSTDINSGMIGTVAVGAGGKAGPTVQIQSPTPGQQVQGTVTVSGKATAGQGGVNVTKVQVRIGTGGAWRDAQLTQATLAWSYQWDTTGSSGATTVYARALSNEFPDPTPVSVDVVVTSGSTSGGLTGSDGNTTNTTTSSGGSPSVGFAAVVGGLAVLVAVVRRRT